jgi:putative ABC transport system ATP-binding protein
MRLTEVNKIYKVGNTNVQALSSINLEIPEGEFIALIGPSGSGKSTLLHLMGCLDKPSSGDVEINGEKILRLNQSELTNFRKDNIGIIFQFFNLIPVLNAAENVVVSRMFDPDKRTNRVFELLQLVGLVHRMEHLPSELSGGERQRLAIARALLNEPKIIIADEPTGNLDSKTTKRIMKLLKKINNQGTTIILATHNQELAKNVNNIIEISDGRLKV